jgi:hypothetical protein
MCELAREIKAHRPETTHPPPSRQTESVTMRLQTKGKRMIKQAQKIEEKEKKIKK